VFIDMSAEMNGAGRKILGKPRLRGFVDKSGRGTPIAVFIGLDRAGKSLDSLAARTLSASRSQWLSNRGGDAKANSA
jgi:hypothetical protein